MKKQELFKAICKRIVENKIRHVQALIRIYQGNMAIKFVSADNDHYKQKIKEICDDYCESMVLAAETKTTLTYII